MQNNLVSVIVPTYNSKNFVSNAIDSILRQTYKGVEIIVIDDFSSDGTYEYLKEKYSGVESIVLLRNDSNVGAAGARNVGISKATGRYIAFLDSDDQWKPEKLEVQIAFMRETDSVLCYSWYDIYTKGEYQSTRSPMLELNYSELLKSNQIPCLTAIYDVEKLGKMYFPNLKKRQDYALWLNILKKDEIARGIPRALAIYNKRDDSLSSNKLSSALYNWELYRKHEKLPLFLAIWYFTIYVIRSLRNEIK